jgi:hypothetical protein
MHNMQGLELKSTRRHNKRYEQALVANLICIPVESSTMICGCQSVSIHEYASFDQTVYSMHHKSLNLGKFGIAKPNIDPCPGGKQNKLNHVGDKESSL